MKFIDADKLITIIEERKAQQDQWINRYHDPINQGISKELTEILSIITSLQQEQPDFDDVDPKHLVHSHYTKVRETKTGRVFWAEYSSEAAEWYEAGTGKAYSISDVEIVKEQPEVDLEKEIVSICETYGITKNFDAELGPLDIKNIARHFYELGLNARKEESVSVAESPSKTFPRVNEFDCGGSYRR